jgi:hypothetical protein
MRVACVSGLYGAMIGLLIGIIAAILWFIVFSVVSSGTTAISGVPITVGGSPLLTIILMPLFYGITGFVGGLILTPLLNLALKMGKGIDFELEAVGPKGPAPQQPATQKPVPQKPAPKAQAPKIQKPAPSQQHVSEYKH